jgi:large subunit ribosomal protein L15
MELHNLKPAAGSTHRTKRVGRGEGSGHGGTSARGGKGQSQVSGYNHKKGFEGGQMPIQRRMPKRGFINPFRVEYKVFNLSQIEELIEKYGLKEFSCDELYVCGLINRTDKVKILGTGELKTVVPFKVDAASASAKAAILALGATLELAIEASAEGDNATEVK